MILTEKDQARFWAKVALPNEQGCMLWTAGLRNADGYGQFWATGATRQAHRVSYELAHGPIPGGLQIDHLCRVRKCVAPEHLEAVTSAENTRRGELGTAPRLTRRLKIHCPQGHSYTGANLYVRPDGGRECRTCNTARHAAAYRARNNRAADPEATVA